MEEEKKKLLQNYQQLVVNSMSCKDPDEKSSIQKQLEEQFKQRAKGGTVNLCRYSR